MDNLAWHTIIQTKLIPPPPRPNIVSRPRLIKQLNQSWQRHLTIVSAPAGFGKTTLISDWLKQQDADSNRAIGWLSLDDGDNDLNRFLMYLKAALQRAWPTDLPEATYLSAQNPLLSTSIEAAIIPLINSLAETATQVALILDDYHLIISPAVHKCVQFLLDHLPKTMNLFLISRVDPPLGLARLRTRQQLVEIRQGDLRFSGRETAVFFKQMGVQLKTADLQTLTERTEGWIASLQLAALSLQEEKDKGHFIQQFSGTHHHILDYLLEEVLQHQPEHLVDFLLQTSIAPRLNASLCQAITGRQDSKQILIQLEQKNLFTVPLDHERHEYRYHHLFAHFLQNRFKEEKGAAVDEAHLRASQWHETHSQIHEAIEHAFAAQAFARTAQLIEQHAARILWGQGEIATLKRWLKQFPSSITKSRAKLCLVQAWHAFEELQFNRAVTYLTRVENLVRNTHPPDEIQGMILATRAFISRAEGQHAQTIQLSQQALALLSEQDHYFLRAVILINVTHIHHRLGDLAAAHTTIAQLLQAASLFDDVQIRLLGLFMKAELLSAQGQLFQASHLYEDALALADEQERSFAASGLIQLGLCQTYYQWNELDRAKKYLKQALTQGEQSNNGDILLHAYQLQILLCQQQGDKKGSQQALEKLKQFARRVDDPQSKLHLDASLARMALVTNDLPSVQRWAAAAGLSANDRPEVTEFHRYHLWVQVQLLNQSKPEDIVIDLLRFMLDTAVRYEQQPIPYALLLARAYHQQGKTKEAQEQVIQAVRWAEPNNHIRPFVVGGAVIETLLTDVLSQNIQPTFCQRLLAAIAAGLSNNAIASELVLSPHTVRSHIKNINTKLNANTRTQAIARAHELNLI
ncbi:LuxR C-terminal-related transcriptional regulator [Candidatus Leptofilum sp.]|uniref:LuxR C-terminal-related transcriptional regulator n=1 Tax=Candidatus Leptofilum sp. TaxID=3241576 RepID=UPI003B5CE369